MNKKLLIAIGAIAIATVLGLIFSQNLSVSAGPNLTEKEVTEKVKAQYPGEIIALQLDEQGTEPVYEVEVVIDGKGYELAIDGNSGKILKLEEKRVAKTGEKKDATADKQESSATEETDLEMKEKATEETKENSNDHKSIISQTEAIEIALEQFSGKVEDIDLDKEDGRLIYEIEIESSQGEAEIEINAYTGEVLIVDIDLN